jgi:hypothetical protein
MEINRDESEGNLEQKENSPVTFPARLFYLLSYQNAELVFPIRWNDDGRSFRIIDKDELCKVIPKVFNRKCLYISIILINFLLNLN